MAADKGTLVSALYRIAMAQTAPATPASYLLDILTGRASRLTGGDGRVRIGSSTGGSSASWMVPDGVSDSEIMELAELALQRLDSGIDAPPTVDSITGAVCYGPFHQVPNSHRLLSFGQFGNIQR